MMEVESNDIIQEYSSFLSNKTFPCVGAKAALARLHIKCMVADHMGCPKDDQNILHFLYHFVEDYRSSTEPFHSAVIIFREPRWISEEGFDELLWRRLQALADFDNRNYTYDKRVNSDPSAANFSFSLKEEAFFIVGLHARSSRPARKFGYPALAFNPHAQFEKLRETTRFDIIKEVVRKRDIAYSGSPNPMLQDFGKSSEARQYSGREYDNQWQCPLHIKHAKIKQD